MKQVNLIISLLSLFFLYFLLSPWIEDWIFSEKDAIEILADNNLNINDNSILIKNEKGGLRDYYQTFELKITNSDYRNIQRYILGNPNFIGFKNENEEIIHKQEECFENENYYVIDKYLSDNDFTHVEIKLNKKSNCIEYVASDE